MVGSGSLDTGGKINKKVSDNYGYKLCFHTHTHIHMIQVLFLIIFWETTYSNKYFEKPTFF